MNINKYIFIVFSFCFYSFIAMASDQVPELKNEDQRFLELETKDLILKKLRAADIVNILNTHYNVIEFDYYFEEDNSSVLPAVYGMYLKADEENILIGFYGFVYLSSDEENEGYFSTQVEIFLKEYRGQGYSYQALLALKGLLDYATSLDSISFIEWGEQIIIKNPIVKANIYNTNLGSLKIHLRGGFVPYEIEMIDENPEFLREYGLFIHTLYNTDIQNAYVGDKTWQDFFKACKDGCDDFREMNDQDLVNTAKGLKRQLHELMS